MRKLTLTLCLCLGQPLLTEQRLLAADETGLQISASGDIVGVVGESTTRSQSINRIDPREAEVSLFAPVDHLFDATVSLAAHREDAAAFFEVHELYVGSSKLIPRSRFRLGQFFLGFGRLNQFHRHDWPFTSPPKVHSDFFAFEAVSDSGLEYSWLTPLPFYLELTGGITNGWVFGHAHNLGTKPLVPLHYLRATTFVSEFLGNGQAQIGLNYIGQNTRSSTNTLSRHFGLDFTAKWREGKTLLFLLQSEAWLRTTRPSGGVAEDAFGMYLYPQYALDEAWKVGLRLDTFSVLSRKDVFGNSAASFYYGVVPNISFQPSEFSTFRLSYNWQGSRLDGREAESEKAVELQAIFILGSHPAHDF